jgi:hypothetical protein
MFNAIPETLVTNRSMRMDDDIAAHPSKAEKRLSIYMFPLLPRADDSSKFYNAVNFIATSQKAHDFRKKA